jgi:hypothetical protein
MPQRAQVRVTPVLERSVRGQAEAGRRLQRFDLRVGVIPNRRTSFEGLVLISSLPGSQQQRRLLEVGKECYSANCRRIARREPTTPPKLLKRKKREPCPVGVIRTHVAPCLSVSYGFDVARDANNTTAAVAHCTRLHVTAGLGPTPLSKSTIGSLNCETRAD